MKGLRLSQNMRMKWSGQDFRIERRLDNNLLQLKNIATNECRAISEAELIEAYTNGDLTLLGQNNDYSNLQAKLEHKRSHDFTVLAEDEKAEIRRKFAYVQAMLDSKEQSFSEEFLIQIISELSEEISDPNPPSTRTIRRWFGDYYESGGDIRAFISASRAQGNRERKFGNNKEQCEIILSVVETAINDSFLTQQRNPVADVYDRVQVEINRLNEYRSEDDKLPMPAKSSIYEIVASLDEYEVDKARFGDEYADVEHRVYQQPERPTRPLERVECDDTKTHLMVVDGEENLPLGRLWFFALICVYTKMILGYFLSFYPPSYVSVMLCLRHAIKPKTYVREKYPMVNNSWDAYGLMETIVVDNAKHWYSKSFDDACFQLGISVQYTPVRMPWYKSSIERFFGTLNKKFLHRQPGTTFSGILDKGDYDPAKHAVITLDELEELLHKWIIDVYCQDEHRGIRDVPARRWRIGVSKILPALPPSLEELDVLLGKIEYRKISKMGIVRDLIFYNCESLVPLRNNQNTGKKLKIKYDPMDLGLIYVYDDFHGRWLPVPALDQDYAKGLTEWQHNVIRKFARKTVRDSIDMVALAEAKDYIQARVREIIAGRAGKKRQNSRVQAARWLTTSDPAEPRLATIIKPQDKGLTTPSENPAQASQFNDQYISETPEISGETDDDSVLSKSIGTDAGDLDSTGWSSGYNLPGKGGLKNNE